MFLPRSQFKPAKKVIASYFHSRQCLSHELTWFYMNILFMAIEFGKALWWKEEKGRLGCDFLRLYWYLSKHVGILFIVHFVTLISCFTVRGILRGLWKGMSVGWVGTNSALLLSKADHFLERDLSRHCLEIWTCKPSNLEWALYHCIT